MTRLKIALLAGGDSPEREIALQSAALIEAALDHSKYDITVIDLHGRDWHHTAPDGRQWQVDKNDFTITAAHFKRIDRIVHRLDPFWSKSSLRPIAEPTDLALFIV